jgi:tetratricopeptide (TPR) repeat protein
MALLINAAAELRKGDAGKARAQLNKAQALSPKDARTYVLLGTASLMQKNLTQALKEFQESLSLDPDRVEALNSLTFTMVQQGQHSAAIERAQKHLTLTKMTAEVHQLLGQLNLAAHEPDKATGNLRRAIEIKPDLITAYFLLAQAFIAQNKIDQAIGEYEKIAEKNPGDPGAQTILGTLFDLKRQHAQANEYYERALTINGNFAPAANNLAWNYAEHGGNLDLALPLAQKARELSPDSPEILDTLGWIYYKKGLVDNAIPLLKDSTEKLKNSDPNVLYHLGMAYHRSGRGAESRNALSKALALNRDFSGAEEARRILTAAIPR